MRGPRLRLLRPVGGVPQLHAETQRHAVAHRGAHRRLARDPAGEQGVGRGDPPGRSRPAPRRPARHDRARVRQRRMAGAVRESQRRRHPGAGHAHLARRGELGVPARHRAAVRPVGAAQRPGPVPLLRARGRLPGDGQRGRRQALRHDRAVRPAAPRLRHPAPGRRGLGRRGGPRQVLRRRGLGRARERLHPAQHDLHDLEPDAPGADVEGCRRPARPRQPAQRVGRRMPLRPPPTTAERPAHETPCLRPACPPPDQSW